jgi:hypothetical protein
MAVATGGSRASEYAWSPSIRSVAHGALLLVGLLIGLRLALPIADVGAQCPAAGEQGHLSCLANKAWLPAAFKAFGAVALAHVLTNLLLARVAAPLRGDRPPVDTGDVDFRQASPIARGSTLALHADRRAAPRAPLALRVEVRREADAEPIAKVWSVDVSLTGLLLAGATPVHTGDSLWLTIHLGTGAPLCVPARVARRARAGRVGVALEGLSSRDRRRLASRLTALC